MICTSSTEDRAVTRRYVEHLQHQKHSMHEPFFVTETKVLIMLLLFVPHRRTATKDRAGVIPISADCCGDLRAKVRTLSATGRTRTAIRRATVDTTSSIRPTQNVGMSEFPSLRTRSPFVPLTQSSFQRNIMCGLLHCSHLNERLEFGMESVAILSHSFFNVDSKIIPCRTANVDLGLQDVDPGLVPNGAKCGHDKMCVNQSCVLISSVLKSECPAQCNFNGVCNNLGKCHCNVGFAPPFCDYPGPGGSEDGGPASDPNGKFA